MTFFSGSQKISKTHPQQQNCPSGFTCKLLAKNTCRNPHHDEDWALSVDYYGLLDMIDQGYTVAAYVNNSSEDEKEEPNYCLSLFNYPQLPVCMSEN